MDPRLEEWRRPYQRLSIWQRLILPIVVGGVIGIAFSFAVRSVFGNDESPTPIPRIELPAASVRVIDGDTAEVAVSLLFHLRIAGVDTPELRKPKQKTAAQVAKAVADAWVTDATTKKQPLAVLFYRLGVYGRVEGDLLNRTTGQRLSAHLIQAGVAVPSTGKRHVWTDEELRRIETKAANER